MSTPLSRRFERFGDVCYVVKSRLDETNAGVFVDGKDAYLIDPCVYPDEIDDVQAFVESQGLNVRGIVLTHSHWDHVLGPERIAGVPVFANSRFNGTVREHLDHLHNELRTWERDSAIERSTPFVPPTVDVEVYDGDTLPYGTRKLRAYHTPGHWDDQMVVHDAEGGVLWAADMLSDVEIPITNDVLAYVRTLERLATLSVQTLIPGHGTPTNDAEEVRRRFSIDRDYLATLVDTVSRYAAEGRTVEESVALQRDFVPPPGRQNVRDHFKNVRSAYGTLAVTDRARGAS